MVLYTAQPPDGPVQDTNVLASTPKLFSRSLHPFCFSRRVQVTDAALAVVVGWIIIASSKLRPFAWGSVAFSIVCLVLFYFCRHDRGPTVRLIRMVC